MAARKLIGYILAFVGIIVMLVGMIPSIKTALKIPSQITDITIVAIGLVIIIVGVVLAYSSGSKQKPTEVPIYEGKDVVGFRRLGKK